MLCEQARCRGGGGGGATWQSDTVAVAAVYRAGLIVSEASAAIPELRAELETGGLLHALVHLRHIQLHAAVLGVAFQALIASTDERRLKRNH
eukprot:COSAG05_NODE_7022_length_865_cov_1.143603_2_plen_92_part_00